MRLNGADLHIVGPVGDGELLILVHGSWTDHTAFAGIAEPLARRFRVVRYDRRGHSRTVYGPGPSPRRQEEADLAALIEALGGPAHLVGTSLGAAICLAVAGRRPDLVRSVVAHEPPLLGVAPDPAAEAALRSVQDQVARGDVAGGTRRFFEELALGPGGWDRIPEPLRRTAMGNAQTFVDLRADPGWGSLDVRAVSAFGGPLTVTRGEASPAWLQRAAAGVATALDCGTEVIPAAGHSPHLTHPAAFATLIARLAGAAAPARAA